MTLLKAPFLPFISGKKKKIKPRKYPMKYDEPIMLYRDFSLHIKFIFKYQLSKYSASSLSGLYSNN